MAIFFSSGEQKIRPGVYQRYENTGGASLAGALNGQVAVVIKSNWGPLGQVQYIETPSQAYKVYGNGGENDTVSIIEEIFKGGASVVKAIRLGAATTPGSINLKDTAGSPADVITMSLKYSGARAFTYSVRANPGVETQKQLIVYDENNIARDTFSFTAGATEVDGLVAAFAEQGSDYITIAKTAEGNGTLALANQQEITAGTNPVITNQSYTDGLNLLEAHNWNVVCVDTSDTDILALLQGYIDRVYSVGKMAFAVIGEPTSVAFATRVSHATAYNNYKVVYFGGAWVDASGKTYEGFEAAARIAGMVASTPSNEAVTHKSISGAVNLKEFLTNSQYESAIKGGMLTASASNAGVIWIDSGITTLVSPSGNDDEGWKKIKRAKIRFELMQRASDTVEPLIGNINNSADGRSTVVQNVQGVINAMVAEQKLVEGAYIEVDSNNPPQGDSAWFNIWADDIDSLEKVYFTFKFRFSPEE